MQCRLGGRIGLFLLIGVLALLAAGCGGAPEGTSSEEETEAPTFTMENVSTLFGSEEDEIKGAQVEDVVGKVTQVQSDADGNAVVVSTDPDGFEGQLVVLNVDDSVREDDYIKFSGQVIDVFDTENRLGAEISLPRVLQSELTKVDATAADPPLRTIKVNQTKDLGGVRITVKRVEISENQTRIWVRYKNNSSDDFFGDPSLTAGGSQVDTDYSDDLKAPSSDLSPGASTSGVLTFEPVRKNSKMKLSFDGYNSNYDEVKVVFAFGGK